MLEKSKGYVANHPHLREESSPFTGKNIPVSRRNHPHLQESAGGNIPVSRIFLQAIVL